MLTTEEQDIEGLVRLKDHQVGSKHDSGCLLLIVVDLDGRVARTTIGHHTRFVPVLLVRERERESQSQSQRVRIYSVSGASCVYLPCILDQWILQNRTSF